MHYPGDMLRSRDWSDVEIAAIVADYFDMLSKELRGENYSKTAHRHALRTLLNDRSDGSVERKHQNISAILREAKFPWVDGYKPLSNYQSRLADAVLERLDEDGDLNQIALQTVESSPITPTIAGDLLNRMTPPPSLLDSRVKHWTTDSERESHGELTTSRAKLATQRSDERVKNS